MVVTQFELEDMLEKSKGRPKFFTLRLAEKLFGIDVLVKSTPYGIGGKAALHPAILDAIKGISKYNISRPVFLRTQCLRNSCFNSVLSKNQKVTTFCEDLVTNAFCKPFKLVRMRGPVLSPLLLTSGD